MDLATSTVAPAVEFDCPACGMRVSLSAPLRLLPSGRLGYDEALGDLSIRLHMRVGCEAA
jgi:hypothetical protein